MKANLFKELQNNSKNFKATPPDRVWSRLEYKLDRAQFERKRINKNKLVYGISAAAVIIFLIAFIGFIKQDSTIISTDTKSEFIVSKSLDNNQGAQQAYDVHTLHSYYSKKENNKYQKHFKEIRVNPNPKG